MTDKEITEMIIREVMGWPVYPLHGPIELVYPQVGVEDDKFILFTGEEPEDENWISTQEFKPLQDMNDAWMVVEKFKERPSVNDISPFWLFCKELGTSLETNYLSNIGTLVGLFFCKDLPRAICLAALAVIDGEKKS